MKYYPPRYLFRRFELLRAVNSGQKFIEVGPGNLELAQELLKFFHQGTVVDFSENTRDIYQNLSPVIRQRLELHITDFLQAEIPADFDCFVACEVLEHVQDEAAFLNKAHNLLRPGGQILLTMPARMKLWSKHDDMVGHVRRYEKNSLRSLLQRHKFQNVSIVAFGFPFVNILRWPRILLARKTWEKVEAKTAKERTAWSGVKQTTNIPRWLGLVCNPYTVYPLAQFSTLFNNMDLSDGYVVSANKE